MFLLICLKKNIKWLHFLHLSATERLEVRHFLWKATSLVWNTLHVHTKGMPLLTLFIHTRAARYENETRTIIAIIVVFYLWHSNKLNWEDQDKSVLFSIMCLSRSFVLDSVSYKKRANKNSQMEDLSEIGIFSDFYICILNQHNFVTKMIWIYIVQP